MSGWARQRVAHEAVQVVVVAVGVDEVDLAPARAQRALGGAEAHLALVLAAERPVAARDQHAAGGVAEPPVDQVRGRRTGRPVVDADVGQARAGRQVRHERDHRDAGRDQALDGAHHARVVGRLEHHSLRPPRGDPVQRARRSRPRVRPP